MSCYIYLGGRYYKWDVCPSEVCVWETHNEFVSERRQGGAQLQKSKINMWPAILWWDARNKCAYGTLHIEDL